MDMEIKDFDKFSGFRINCTKDLVFKGSISAIVGMILGIMCSLIVNCTLVEVSLSKFFSMYFGILFIVVGIIIFWRLNANVIEEAENRRNQLMILAGLIVFSGILCLFFERSWLFSLSPLSKVPIYCVLGISISFALTFSLIDLINYLIGFIQGSITRPLIESVAQVYLILLFTITMGGIFGFIFGLLDVEDESSHHIRLALMKAENCCFPLGAILGGLAGFGNEVFRQQSEAYKIENVTEFDDEV
ncbi:hypothetical protein, conserved [Plasmodium gonderi]|uniref:Uncharacterized protein n=1 Tax=Plasmodium gonderi TaxID=77519 RepID=A0A1Y1JM31_PLAGO|nr:hypothetical protein, conserved [Plasmodium gonderi]GAW83531.1 hypothetical protein, conserved [Plasmodium gonderi]